MVPHHREVSEPAKVGHALTVSANRNKTVISGVAVLLLCAERVRACPIFISLPYGVVYTIEEDKCCVTNSYSHINSATNCIT